MQIAHSIPPRPATRLFELVLWLTSLAWVAAASELAVRAARGFTLRSQLPDAFQLLDAVFLVFLLGLGFALLDNIMARSPSFANLRRTLGLPRRPSAAREWATGAAIGWGIVVAALLPLATRLNLRLWLAPRSFILVVLHLAAAALLALASEFAFRGFPYRRLISAIGAFWGTIVMALLYGWVVSGWVFSFALTPRGESSFASDIAGVLLGLLLAAGWLRTHGLWLSWGLHFAWIAALGVLFGLPVNGLDNLSSIVQTRPFGPRWLTGGDFGPGASALTVVLMLAALIVLIRATRDWAWFYTHPPIVPAGYPMEVAPPAAHTAMEDSAAPAPPRLVQILPTTSQSQSVPSPPPHP